MDVRVIRTGVQLSVFSPRDRRDAKLTLGLDPDKSVLLFGANSVRDSIKGFQYLPQLVQVLNKSLGMAGQYSALLIGGGSADLSQLQCAVHVTGYIDDRQKLASIYSAADVTVLPYMEDNLPNICLESMACGTPVVAFRAGGLPEVVLPGVNGALASAFDVWELANKTAGLVHEPIAPQVIRQWAERHLDIRQQAGQYIDLFNELLVATPASVKV